MPGHHYIPRRLIHDDVDNAYVAWCRRPPRTAVVFVHGFGGDAFNTWRHFDVLLPFEGTFAESDLYFFGYDSVHVGIADATSLLCEFMDLISVESWSLFEATRTPRMPSRSKSDEYRHFVMVGHSLGSVVARLALFRTRGHKHNRRSWAKAQLVLFAPVHCGASPMVVVRAAEGLHLFSLLAAGIGWWRYPALSDLKPGSEFLRDLRDTARELSRDPSEAVNARPVHALGDKIAKNCEFPGDLSPVLVKNVTHSSICKPHGRYMRPIAIVKQALTP